MISVIEPERQQKRPKPISEWFNDASRAPAPPVYYNLEAEYGALSEPKETNDQKILKARALGIDDINLANDGKSKDEIEQEKREEQNRNFAASNFFKFTTQDVLSGLEQSLATDSALLTFEKGFYKPVEDKDMLRNSKGEIVKTQEEKERMEAEGRDCKALLAQDETAYDDHSRMVITKKDYEGNMRIREQMEYKTTIYAKVKSGEMDPNDVPEHLKKDLKDRMYGNNPNPDPTFLDRLKANYDGFPPTAEIPTLSAKISVPAQQTYTPKPLTDIGPAPSMQ